MSTASISLQFGVKLRFSILDAFLSAVGPMLCDPEVRVYEMSRTGPVTKTLLGSTSKKLFTSYPVWNETLELVLPTVQQDTVVMIEIKDGTTGQFLGTAVAPFGLQLNSNGVAKRLMLLPRCALSSGLSANPDDERDDADLQVLKRFCVDDFGHISISWDVSLLPVGGTVPATEGSLEAPVSQLPPSVYCTTMIQWLVAGAASPGTVHRTVAIVGDQQIPLDGGIPVTTLLPVNCSRIQFSLQKRCPTDIGTEEMVLDCPLPVGAPLGTTTYWTLPATTRDRETSWGALIVHVQLNSAAPSATPKYQAATTRQPECHPTLAGPVSWESDAHFSRATERRWRRSCVVEARPTVNHLRHVLDVSMKRAAIDPSMNNLVSAFYSNSSVDNVDLREMLIAMTFGLPEVNIPEAARFAFAVMRQDAERAVTFKDIMFVVEHSLLPQSLDLTAEDLAQRVRSLFLLPSADANPYVAFDKYMEAMKNFAFWVTLGVALDDPNAERTATVEEEKAKVEEADPWRQVTMRVIKTGRAYAVTVHEKDSIERVKAMVQDTISISAPRQRYTFDGKVLENNQAVGQSMQKEKLEANFEVSVTEVEEMITVIFVHRNMHRKWEQKLKVTDKVLKLRGLIQTKTMIPLSRLQLTYAGQVLWDRHSLDHYKMVDGSVVEVAESR